MQRDPIIELVPLSDRLRNWARWARGGYALKSCGSAEGNYRANWRQWLTLQEIGCPDPIDTFDAMTVEQAWRRCSHKTKMLLKYRYIWKAPDDYICRNTRVKPININRAISRARFELKNTLYALTVYKNTSITSPTADTPRKR